MIKELLQYKFLGVKKSFLSISKTKVKISINHPNSIQDKTNLIEVL